MTYGRLKAHFFSTLKEIYSDEELEEIYNLLLEQNNQMSRLDFVLKREEKAKSTALWEEQTQRLLTGEPIQYILGNADFWGMKLLVDPNVLIPRPETEELVQLILKNEGHRANLKILDIGTGSGCISLALKKEMPTADVNGIDVSSGALEIAKSNGALLNLNIDWVLADIATLQTDTNFDIIVSNPPYIPVSDKSEMAANVLNYEPHLALFAPEDDPLFFYKKIGEFASSHLKKGQGKLYFEAHHLYSKNVANYFESLAEVELIKDMFGKPRFIVISY